MQRRWLAVAGCVAAGTAAAAASVSLGAQGDAQDRRATAVLVDAEGERVGRVVLRQRGERVRVRVRARGLPPGFHGFHVHAVGRCEAPAFTSAGGHLALGEQAHPDHAGDLPVLLVRADGRGFGATSTDRFALSDLRDENGSALIVHAAADNYANIPPRYGTPDEMTRAAGDSGARIACGVVR